MKIHWHKLAVWSIVLSAGLIAGARILFAHAVSAAPTSSITFTVNSTSDAVDDNTLDGVCHTASNTCTLRAAIMQADALVGSDVTISLPSGVYGLSIGPIGSDDAASGDLNLTLPVSGNPIITIIGAGIGQTIIDGHGTDRIFSVETNRTVYLNGVTLRNGQVAGFNQGGAVIVTGTLTINNSQIISNSAVNNGGGVQNNGTLNINHSIVADNQSGSDYGGGIANDINGQLTIDSSSILNNHANNATGGGIYNYSNVVNGLTISNTTISGNTAYDGGGIGSDWQIDPIRILNSALYSNSASANGGGIYLGCCNSGDVHVVNSTVSYNSANGDGGGIASAHSAGHIWLYNATIAYNTAGALVDRVANGGGIASLAGAVFTSTYSLIVFNTDTRHYAPFNFILPENNECYGTFGYEQEDIMFGINTGRCNPPGLYYTGDPLIGPLRNNGGSAWTHALLPNSPAIDAGLFCSDDSGNPLNFDQRGFARFVDGACDIGAYESGWWTYLPLALKNH